mmetsp:Transcript_22368/g.51245  ORF Transcript_22368/g.51245 Transcript_22368/m.51245 type:complete len:874 (-) Transcript_22368:114-2735(-)
MLVLPPRALHWSPDTDEPSFVSSIASISSSDEVKRDLNTLASVRRSLLTGSDVEASIQRLQEYHALLIGCEDRGVPLVGEDGPESRWESYMEVGRVFSRRGIRHERASILHNLASALSVAASAAATVSGGSESSSRYLQEAAGIMRYLRSLEFLSAGESPPGVDLSPTAMEFHEKVLLGQAQGILYRRAAQGETGASPNVLAKAARGTAALYEHAGRHASAPPLSNSLSGAWRTCISANVFWYKSMAEYWTVLEVAQNVGEGLCRLRMAEAMIEQGIVAMKRVTSDEGVWADAARSEMEGWKQTILSRRSDLEVQAAGIPAVRPTDLKPIKAALLVKPIPPSDALFKYPSTFLPGLLPHSSRVAYNSFLSSTDELLAQCKTEAAAAQDVARSALREMHLPASLEYMAGGGGVPAGLWNKIAALQRDPEFCRLGQGGNQEAASAAASRLHGITAACTQILEEDAQFKLLHSAYMPPPGSTARVKQIASELQRLKGTLDRARQADMVVYNRIVGADGTEARSWLMKFRAELDSHVLPSGTITEEDRKKMDFKTLKSLLLQMNNLIKKREKVISDFPMRRDELELSSKFSNVDHTKLEQSTNNDSDIINRAMASMATVRGEIRDSISQQRILLDKIRNENHVFQQFRQRNPAIHAQAEAFCNKLERAIQLVSSIIRGVRDGSAFYERLSLQLDGHSKVVSAASAAHMQVRTDHEDAIVNQSVRENQERIDADVAVRMAEEMVRERKVLQPRAIRDRRDVNPDEGYVPPSLPGLLGSRGDGDTNIGSGGNVEEEIAPLVAPTPASFPMGRPRVPMEGFGSDSLPPPSSSRITAVTAPEDALVASIAEMGFEVNVVKSALIRHGNNRDEAINDLLGSN